MPLTFKVSLQRFPALSFLNLKKPLIFSGFILVCSGIFHSVVFLSSGVTWEGPLSWRKPILFGLSGGVTALSLGWVLSLMARWRLASFLDWTLSIALLAEVGLITMQTWRGVASHFNQSTAFESIVSATMGWLILVVSLGILAITLRSLKPLQASPSVALAVRFGLILLVLACLLGWLAQVIGEAELAAGRNPETYKKAGVLKFPHGMPLHAIQVLPLLAWFTGIAGWNKQNRLLSVWMGGIGYLLITAFSLEQTFLGRSRYDLTFSSGLLLVTGLLALGIPPLFVGIRVIRKGLHPQNQRAKYRN